jgi:hypothetical protein
LDEYSATVTLTVPAFALAVKASAPTPASMRPFRLKTVLVRRVFNFVFPLLEPQTLRKRLGNMVLL